MHMLSGHQVLFITCDAQDNLYAISPENRVLVWDKSDKKFTPSAQHSNQPSRSRSPITKIAAANEIAHIVLRDDGTVEEYWRIGKKRLQGRAIDIAGGLDNFFYKIDQADGKIYKRGHTLSIDDKWSLFKSQPPVKAKKIAVSKHGNPWIIDSSGNIYNHWKGKWYQKKGEKAENIIIDKQDQVFVYGPDKIRKYNFKSKSWDTYTPRSKSIASNGKTMYLSAGSKGVMYFSLQGTMRINPALLNSSADQSKKNLKLAGPNLYHYKYLKEFSTPLSQDPATINIETGYTSLDFELHLPKGVQATTMRIEISHSPFSEEGAMFLDQFEKDIVGELGRFEIDFLNYKYHMPRPGHPFYVRTTLFNEGQVTLSPSNTILVNWTTDKNPDFSFIETDEWKEATKHTATKPKGSNIRIYISDLICIEPNEYEKSDISFHANQGPGDEPYYVGFSVLGKLTDLEVKEVHPFHKRFTNVKTGESVSGPFPMIQHQIFPPDPTTWHYLLEDEFVGYALQLWEWDEGDASQRYADMSTMVGVATAAAGAIFSKGATLKTPGQTEALFNMGAGTMDQFWKLLEKLDGDDLIDSTGILFDHRMLTEAVVQWRRDQDRAAKGGHQEEVYYPWLKAMYQEYADLNYFFELKGEDAIYRLKIMVRTPNEIYVGPYRH